MDLQAIIKPVHVASPSRGVDVELTYLTSYLENMAGIMPVELNPDFQRGHVWTKKQQIAYLESLFQRKLSKQARTISFNQCGYEDDSDSQLLNEVSTDIYKKFICIDGLQRLTACLSFISGDLKLYDNQLSYSDLVKSKEHLKFTNNANSVLRFEFYDFNNKKDLMQFYVDFNNAGTPHSKEEIDRVKSLIDSLS